MVVVASSTATATCMSMSYINFKDLQLHLQFKPYNSYSFSHFKTTTTSTNFALPNKVVGSRKFLVRCTTSNIDSNNNNNNESGSGDDSLSDTMTTTTTREEETWKGSESESSPAEVPKRAPSLISSLNVEKALRGIAITDVDHYGRLGLRIGCTYDQVRVAYKDKIKEIMSQGLDEEELNKKQELLKESYTILSSEEERRLYDWSLARSENPERYAWPFEVDITQTPKGTPPPQEPEDVGPTRLVGYFLLGWLVLGFTLSIALNL